MTPVLSLLEASVRSFFIERRRFTRRKASLAVCLPVGVSVPNDRLDPEAEEYPNPIMGHTNDLSETGLSLVLPTLMLGGEQIDAEHFPLRLVLSLPGGVAVVQAYAVRVETCETTPGTRGYMVGARIKRMSERDRKHYMALLRSLDRI
ncbi:MAG TPA: PilZ domain-containing protein [Pyrinomonadaceae bacterium]|nr:PilZ domain-containing protein [Pyrinomonadaceae bacterium]